MQTGQSPYLLYCHNAGHFALCWLSNGIFQARFRDDSDLLIEGELVHLIRKGKRTTFRSAAIEIESEEIRQKYHQVCALIKRIKRPKGEEKREKENMGQSGSQVRLLRKTESRPALVKQFSSTSSLHAQPARPFSEYCSNGKHEAH
jgi:hypothetical protein